MTIGSVLSPGTFAPYAPNGFQSLSSGFKAFKTKIHLTVAPNCSGLHQIALISKAHPIAPSPDPTPDRAIGAYNLSARSDFRTGLVRMVKPFLWCHTRANQPRHGGKQKLVAKPAGFSIAFDLRRVHSHLGVSAYMTAIEPMNIPEYITKEEVRRVCSAIGIRDWTSLTDAKVKLEEAEVIKKLVGGETLAISTEDFRDGLEVELEHGLAFSDANVTNNHPILTGRIVLAHLKE